MYAQDLQSSPSLQIAYLVFAAVSCDLDLKTNAFSTVYFSLAVSVGQAEDLHYV